ncbi:purine-binding chemotaxis protein CheW [Rhodobacter sp. JA431]|uniref:chemotaxis protein CheW n=1 Tax=Rhodobacter sp. JA431 TaxID=570013 RepID=UPI000BD77A8C|nr:chemotaxis protein CheW [Rhodobacter sp. JA431]SOC16015.1 purine-binding chemotaxis protein CheW [Rhodobacter sp. JA431]
MIGPQVLTLQIDSDLFALPVARVQEILDLAPFLKVPHWPTHLLGVIDVRGTGVAVVDLRRLLGLAPKPDDAATRLVVLRLDTPRGPLGIALKTERVLEVTELDGPKQDPLPETGMADGVSRFVAGLGRRDGKLVAMLDLDGMFDAETLDQAQGAKAA